jgi:monofunctional biosynthetic peptidoglycan transglycosylase
MKRRPPRIPKYKRPNRRSWPARILTFLFRLLLILLVGSVLWVLAYRIINPPITATMMGDVLAGQGATRDWMPIERIDRDMVRASIAAEDSKFCQHNGFDVEAIENAMKRNASGGRIRGGSTISQQTAKNAFLWQGGGYARKGVEAWFTFLIENLWSKRRIMEVYLNVAETGIGTYGVNAGSERYYGHDASAMSASEAARIAAVLPLPKQRGVLSPKGFTRRYGNSITARIGVVARDGLDACIYAGTTPPKNKAAPKSSKPAVTPGEEYESAKPLPPIADVVKDLPEVQSEPEASPQPEAEPADEPAPPAEAQEPEAPLVEQSPEPPSAQ